MTSTLPLVLTLSLLLLGSPARADPSEMMNVSGTYESLMELVESEGKKAVSAAIDLDQVQMLNLRSYRPGMYYLYSASHHSSHRVDQAQKVVVLIHGVDEPGRNWDTAVRLLVRDPSLLVFLFIWTKWNRPHSLEYWIGLNLSILGRTFSNRVPEMEVVAHSAGGLLMLQALCDTTVSRMCAYDPSKFYELKVRFHTIASPLGGFGIRAIGLSGIFAGPVTSHVGSKVYYHDLQKDLDLTIWYTTFEHDGVLRQSGQEDMRFPRFDGPGITYKKTELPQCSHDEAILEGLTRIFGLPRAQNLPGDPLWKLRYRDEGKVSPYEPRVGSEWKKTENNEGLLTPVEPREGNEWKATEKHEGQLTPHTPREGNEWRALKQKGNSDGGIDGGDGSNLQQR